MVPEHRGPKSEPTITSAAGGTSESGKGTFASFAHAASSGMTGEVCTCTGGRAGDGVHEKKLAAVAPTSKVVRGRFENVSGNGARRYRTCERQGTARTASHVKREIPSPGSVVMRVPSALT